MRCANPAAVWAATYLAPDADCAQLLASCYELAEAGGAEVLLQHGLSEALVLPGHRAMPSSKLRQVRGVSRRPGLSNCTGLVHQLCMASAGSAKGQCSSMVGLHSLITYLSCSCEAAMVQAGRCSGNNSSNGAGCDWDWVVEPGWPPPAAAAGTC